MICCDERSALADMADFARICLILRHEPSQLQIRCLKIVNVDNRHMKVLLRMTSSNRSHKVVKIREIRVFPCPADRRRGTIIAGRLRLPCALGAGGVTALKREGDGATPAGRYRLLTVKVRHDRRAGLRTGVPVSVIRPDDAWSEDPRSGRYNRLIRRSPGQPGDRLWRNDRLYDIVGILDWNIRPRVSYRGSAIFLHLCRTGYLPTAGCIALEPDHLRRLLAACSGQSLFIVGGGNRKVRRRA